MKLLIFGLSISSSWGNGHATLWRGLCRALVRRGHQVVFFERDVPYYAAHRDMHELRGVEIILYDGWREVLPVARRHLGDADAAIVTSYCPDGIAAGEAVLTSAVPVRAFYDMDTPVTLSRLLAGEPVPYIGEDGFAPFDLVLSFTGGRALDELSDRLGARRVVPLFGSADPEVHQPAGTNPAFAADLSYLGTYAADRQEALDTLLLEPARRLPGGRFLIGGAQYPESFPWPANMNFVRHLPPSEHPAFFSSCRLTLNVTRAAMAAMGHCPSGRLFEAAACGAPMITDEWDGLESFFMPGREVVVARGTADVIAALSLGDAELGAMARAARERVLAEHSAECRAAELEAALWSCDGRSTASGVAASRQA